MEPLKQDRSICSGMEIKGTELVQAEEKTQKIHINLLIVLFPYEHA